MFGSVSLGTYGEMQRKSDCVTCQQIAAFRPMSPDTKMELMRFRQPASEYQIADEDYTDFMMDIIPLRATAKAQSHGVLLDEGWIDVGKIRAWLGYCTKAHDDACSHLSGIPPVEALLLIDVEKGCLVEHPGDVGYFALSYVWGRLENTAETRVSNVERLRQPGSITANTPDSNLPETIRDAIRLVQAIGERFLWVDRLCIVQDDHSSKAKAIQAMGAIYANAHCTIVAADGQDADYGLRGIGHGSQPRRRPQQLLDFPHCGPLLQQPEINAEAQSRWGTRGWTYQEQLCSRRLLIFAEQTVAWRCQRAEWREDMTAEPDEPHAPRPPLLTNKFDVLHARAWPDIMQWCSLLHRYNRRELSYVSDTRAAFTGIETILARAFLRGFCYGMPELFFDLALLWQPMRPMTRRTMALGSGDEDGYLPSWSCLGWHGCPDPLSYAAHDYIASIDGGAWFRRTTLRLTPLVDWIQLGPSREVHGSWNKAGRRERRIKSSYLTWRDAVGETAAGDTGLEGWQLHDTALNGGRAWYSHPAAEGVIFNYPIPMPSAALQQQYESYSHWSPLLRLRSKGARFVACGSAPGLDMRQVLCVYLQDVKVGQWAGLLRLNEPLDGTNFSEGEYCELVAISEGSARNDADESPYLEEWNCNKRPGFGSADGCYQFYNVLWVQREADGCTTRKALGRVEKSVWERQDLMDMDVLLR
ncbi:heterokaryon incompatibility protein [Diplodia corticola]|uniref:Heterokaryon incompatibility protein n=1 Tax=Diplodia corticola TaxID=236234 RepID=A0A1J9QZB2_9PEZI|nr:heterokaryon incompatibility protein [Diplodia corticola]OJD33736.1 heterokaryon incompatibility protein [Diplodia corticola]